MEYLMLIFIFSYLLLTVVMFLINMVTYFKVPPILRWSFVHFTSFIVIKCVIPSLYPFTDSMVAL